MNTAFAVSWNKENIPPKGTLNIRLICYDKQFFNDRLLGEFNSALSPQFTLDFEKIDEESLRMDVKHEEMGKFYLTSYNRVDNLCEWGPSDKVYETEGQQVIFGDKIHGRLPADMNNQLMITGFAYSSGKNTVVSAGSICQAVGNYEASWGNIEITTLEDTIEGSEEETVAEAMERFNEYFNQKERMVTQEEYISYIKNTPGLLIHKVKVISQIEAQGQKEAENQICLLVQPYGEETHPALSSVYKEMILNHIEPVRLLTSEILVEGPIYIGIYVRVKICRKKGYDSKMIEEAIYKVCQEKIDSEKTARNFGESISYSELFQSVQQVDGVLYMEELILKRAEDEVEINNYCSAKDITCHYNELTYLEKLEIQID